MKPKTQVYTAPPPVFSSKIEVSGCFCEHEKQLLFLLRHPESLQGSTWCIPGGKLFSYETPLKAAVRELHEESGLQLESHALKPVCTLFVQRPDNDFVFHIFRAHLEKKPESIVLSPREHVDFCWVSAQDALKMPLIDGADQILHLLYI
jgi:8-oxo-dGTP diphosphatase